MHGWRGLCFSSALCHLRLQIKSSFSVIIIVLACMAEHETSLAEKKKKKTQNFSRHPQENVMTNSVCVSQFLLSVDC